MEVKLLQYAITALAFLVGTLGLISWRLTRAIITLREENQDLSRAVARAGNDLAGIASAGVHIDRMLVEQERRLRDCLERLDSVRAEEPSPGMPYHAPIERIREGASAEDLVTEFGLSLSEATLLVRLHSFGK